MVHGRPMLLSMQLTHLGGRPALLDTDPVLQWFAQLATSQPPRARRFTRADFRGLEALGYRFVVLHRLDVAEHRWRLASDALSGLGEPWQRDGEHWLAWDLSRDLRASAVSLLPAPVSSLRPEPTSPVTPA